MSDGLNLYWRWRDKCDCIERVLDDAPSVDVRIDAAYEAGFEAGYTKRAQADGGKAGGEPERGKKGA